MRKQTEDQRVIGALIAFALWVFVVLPLYYIASNNDAANKCALKENQNYSTFRLIGCYLAERRMAVPQNWASVVRG